MVVEAISTNRRPSAPLGSDEITEGDVQAEDTIDFSVVVPLLNEEENLEALYSQLDHALSGLGKTYELIFIDDGSSDGSFAILQELAERDSHVRLIQLRRNFGQTAAFSAGFDCARGEVIITMDADLQNDPADIPMLLERMEEGYDIVSGWRVHRQDQFLKRRLPSKIANALISRLTGVKLHDYGCSLKAYRRDVIKGLRLYGEMHRFIPALASWMGVRVAEVPVNDRQRKFGKSKYGISRTLRVFLDLITVRFMLSYSTRPLHIFGGLGLICFAAGFIIGLYLTFVKLALGQDIGTRPLLLLAVLLVILGVQMVSMGLLAEMITRTYHEAQDKPIYVIREQLDGNE
jgi:glycosyltransferase involved in cell wall biosynthesis